MIDQPYDYLIAFHTVTSVLKRSSEPSLPTDSLQKENDQEKIIDIYWVSYDMKKRIATNEWEYFIKPENFTALPSETITHTKITSEDIQSKGISLVQAMHHFNEAIYLNYVCNNLSFCLVTEDDHILTKVLPTNAKDVGVKLASHFLSYFNIKEEFKRLYKINKSLKHMKEYMSLINLKENEASNISQSEVKNMITLIDRLINDGHKFQNPKSLNAQHQIISENFEQALSDNESQPNLSFIPFVNSPESYISLNTSKRWFVRMRGLPFSARELEVLNFLKTARVSLEDITLLYGFDGRFSGEAYAQFTNENDFKTALSLNLSNIGTRYIEVFETTEDDFNRAKISQLPQKAKQEQSRNSNWGHLIDENSGVLRMRGLPYSCTTDDIKIFFNGFRILKDGIKRAGSGGRPSGECYVVFASKDEAHKAMEKNMEKIGSRFIELFSSNVRELEVFLQNNSSNNHANNSSYSKQNVPSIPIEKRKCTLMMVGLPFNINKIDVVKFFDNFRLKECDVYLISNNNGRFSGNALITFRDELEAQEALKSKNLSYMGNRYIELYEYR